QGDTARAAFLREDKFKDKDGESSSLAIRLGAGRVAAGGKWKVPELPRPSWGPAPGDVLERKRPRTREDALGVHSICRGPERPVAGWWGRSRPTSGQPMWSG